MVRGIDVGHISGLRHVGEIDPEVKRRATRTARVTDDRSTASATGCLIPEIT
jgi:hypothetical protein